MIWFPSAACLGRFSLVRRQDLTWPALAGEVVVAQCTPRRMQMRILLIAIPSGNLSSKKTSRSDSTSLTLVISSLTLLHIPPLSVSAWGTKRILKTPFLMLLNFFDSIIFQSHCYIRSNMQNWEIIELLFQLLRLVDCLQKKCPINVLIFD